MNIHIELNLKKTQNNKPKQKKSENDLGDSFKRCFHFVFITGGLPVVMGL